MFVFGGKYRGKVYNSKKPKWIIVTLVILILNIGACGYVLRKQSFFLIIADIIAAFFVIYALNKKASAFILIWINGDIVWK